MSKALKAVFLRQPFAPLLTFVVSSFPTGKKFSPCHSLTSGVPSTTQHEKRRLWLQDLFNPPPS